MKNPYIFFHQYRITGREDSQILYFYTFTFHIMALLYRLLNLDLCEKIIINVCIFLKDSNFFISEKTLSLGLGIEAKH